MERTWLIGGGALLTALLAASVIVALARGESEFERGSPELAVQRYLKALADGDFETAESLWSPDLREDCSFEEFLLNVKGGLERLSGARVTLDDVQTVGETTIVSVRVVRTTGGGLFGPSETMRSYDYTVRRFEEDWRIVDHTWPSDRCIRSHTAPEPPPPPTTSLRLD